MRWIEDYGHHVTLDAGEFFYVFINDATDKLRERADELEAVNAQLREAYARELEHRTMLRNALSEAEAANVAKNTFLSNMSHDIRTPLNAVVGYASLISAHGGEAERVRAYSDKVLAASEQLLDVVNETLEISRMEAATCSWPRRNARFPSWSCRCAWTWWTWPIVPMSPWSAMLSL